MKKRLYSELTEKDIVETVEGAPHAYIHNIVSTSKILSSGHNIDLEKLNEILPSSHYDKSRFAAITIRIGNPACTALLFTSGKLVVTGAVCWYECLLAAKEITRILQGCVIGQKFWHISCDIQNIVAKTTVTSHSGEYLDIDMMYQAHNKLCTYQKSMFPGLIFRPHRSPVVLLCFHSGKIVITGGKRELDVYVGWKMLWPIVKTFVRAKNKGLPRA